MQRLFLVGFMGCGKSATGRRVAAQLGWQFIDMDKFLENRFCKTVPELFMELGQAQFRRIEHQVLLELLAYEQVVVATGGGVACFYDNMQLMNAAGTTVYLQASPEQLTVQLSTAKVERPLLKGKSEQELLLYVRQLLAERLEYYQQAQYTVVTSCDKSFSHVDTLIQLINNQSF